MTMIDPEPQSETLDVSQININSKLYMDTLRQDYFDHERELLRILISRAFPDKDEFYIRLADNMNYFIHHDGKQLVVGELDLFIDDQYKSFILNADKSVSPSTNLNQIICIDEQNVMLLIDKEKVSGPHDQRAYKKCTFQNFVVPDFIPFKREFTLGSNKVILEKLPVRKNYEESNWYAH